MGNYINTEPFWFDEEYVDKYPLPELQKQEEQQQQTLDYNSHHTLKRRRYSKKKSKSEPENQQLSHHGGVQTIMEEEEDEEEQYEMSDHKRFRLYTGEMNSLWSCGTSSTSSLPPLEKMDVEARHYKENYSELHKQQVYEVNQYERLIQQDQDPEEGTEFLSEQQFVNHEEPVREQEPEEVKEEEQLELRQRGLKNSEFTVTSRIANIGAPGDSAAANNLETDTDSESESDSSSDSNSDSETDTDSESDSSSSPSSPDSCASFDLNSNSDSDENSDDSYSSILFNSMDVPFYLYRYKKLMHQKRCPLLEWTQRKLILTQELINCNASYGDSGVNEVYDHLRQLRIYHRRLLRSQSNLLQEPKKECIPGDIAKSEQLIRMMSRAKRNRQTKG